MKYLLSPFHLVLLALYITCNNSFCITHAQQHQQSQPISTTTVTSSTSSSSDAEATCNDEESASEQTDSSNTIMDQETLMKSIEEVKKAAGMDTSSPGKTDDGKDIAYVIGKTTATCSLIPEPGINLAEAAETKVVLINGVTQKAFDEGIRPLDTIVEVSVITGDDGETTFKENTLGLDIEATARTLMSASNHAAMNNVSEIQFVLNRLIQGYFGAEEE